MLLRWMATMLRVGTGPCAFTVYTAGLASAWLLLDQQPNLPEVVGGVVLILGVLVAMRPAGRRLNPGQPAVALVGFQLPWNPTGTLAGSCTDATSSRVSASSSTSSLAPRSRSKT